jgi:glycosyltransferase involved in cell wall biosynthesis
MRVLVFHGYLLRGTGSNIYNAHVARALAGLGHEVHLLCQDRHAADLGFVEATGSWDEGGDLRVHGPQDARCTAYRPEIGRLLPVYVADEYEGFDARPFGELSDEEIERYVEANVSAVREVAERADPDVAVANHAVMGPAILARALGDRVPYAVKIHGSALEYTVRPDPDRFLPWVREGLGPARAVLVGSGHMAERLWDLVDLDGLRGKTRLGPPGVDVHEFRPRAPGEAAKGLRELADRLEGAGGAASWGGEPGAASALRSLDPAKDRIVSYVGKLIVSKGVDLLVAAWPLVVREVPEARLVVVGFGTYREAIERMVRALATQDLDDLREVAERGRALEGGDEGELRHLAAFLDGLEGPGREAYLDAAPGAAERMHLTGRLEHGDLADLLPACEAQVVPSTFPEAFGMVAAEAAACGALPLSAGHSGLAEVTAALADALDEPARDLLSFEVGPGAVEEIAEKLVRWLRLDPEDRGRARERLADLARGRYAWEGVAKGLLAAAQGHLDELPEPGEPAAPLRPSSG